MSFPVIMPAMSYVSVAPLEFLPRIGNCGRNTHCDHSPQLHWISIWRLFSHQKSQNTHSPLMNFLIPFCYKQILTTISLVFLLHNWNYKVLYVFVNIFFFLSWKKKTHTQQHDWNYYRNSIGRCQSWDSSLWYKP